jgi:hypothetical protein
VLVAERAGVIAPEPGIAGAAGYADVLLDGLFRRQGLYRLGAAPVRGGWCLGVRLSSTHFQPPLTLVLLSSVD